MRYLDQMSDAVHHDVARKLFHNLHKQWTVTIDRDDQNDNFATTVRDYLDFIRDLRDKPNMSSLIDILYPEIDGTPAPTRPVGDPALSARDQLSASLEMVEIIEEGWMGADRDQQGDRKLSRGWLNTSRRWMHSDILRTHWLLVRGEFDDHFVRFCEDELNADPGTSELIAMPQRGFGQQLEVLVNTFKAEWPGFHARLAQGFESLAASCKMSVDDVPDGARMERRTVSDIEQEKQQRIEATWIVELHSVDRSVKLPVGLIVVLSSPKDIESYHDTIGFARSSPVQGAASDAKRSSVRRLLNSFLTALDFESNVVMHREYKTANTSQDKSDSMRAPAFELLVWIAGPFRHAGVGTQICRALFREEGVLSIWMKKSDVIKSRWLVRFPEGNAPGATYRKRRDGWLSFFQYFDFRTLHQYAKASSEPTDDLLLFRDFDANGDSRVTNAGRLA